MPSVRFLRISDEALDLLERLAAAAGKAREAMLEGLVRTAAEAQGLTPSPREPSSNWRPLMRRLQSVLTDAGGESASSQLTKRENRISATSSFSTKRGLRSKCLGHAAVAALGSVGHGVRRESPLAGQGAGQAIASGTDAPTMTLCFH